MPKVWLDENFASAERFRGRRTKRDQYTSANLWTMWRRAGILRDGLRRGRFCLARELARGSGRADCEQARGLHDEFRVPVGDRLFLQLRGDGCKSG